ncbi:MAG: hypothetical protein JSW73_03960 [Candidatus Woesearchaeota archaeon]|nr:MAG: hypothetical protein JSW73_03960 [Candidatus Woesearchaeota archaeon]
MAVMETLGYLFSYWYIFVAILVFILMLIIIKIHKTPKSELITMEEARRLAESKIIQNGIPIHDVKIEDPLKEECRGRGYWSVRYTANNKEPEEIIISEYGNIIEEGISKERALEIAKREFERRGIDLIRVKLDEELKKIKSREYWIVRYTTSYGFSDKVMISKKVGLISY